MQNNPLISYMAALIQTTGRIAFSEEKLIEIALPKYSEKILHAYNLADGTYTLSQICKKLKLDTSNFSKTVARWVSAGVMFKINDGKETKLLHLYQINNIKKPKRGK